MNVKDSFLHIYIHIIYIYIQLGEVYQLTVKKRWSTSIEPFPGAAKPGGGRRFL